MRKPLGKSLLLAVLAAMLLTVTAFAAEVNKGFVNTEALRLRAEPSTEAATVTYLSNGDEVEIMETAGEWYRVSCEGYIGYVYASYISGWDSDVLSAGAPQESVAGKLGVLSAGDVNFLTDPSEDAGVIYTMDKGMWVTVVSISGDWCKVTREGQEGYVNAAYVTVDGIPLVDPQGVVTGSCVNVRSIPSTDGSILTKVYAGKKVDLISLNDSWYTVSIDGTVGYIRSDYIRIYAPGTSSGVGADAAAAAYDYLGVRYRYGGASPSGFDCSGFTMYIYSLFGYSLPHSATSQWNSTGTYVDRADLEPGDLVLFCDPYQSKGKACSHVGIYVGDGQFIHASSSATGYVMVSSLSESYYNNYYVGAKRVA